MFVGSTLLFLVQPMAAKTLLPIFGGSPAVWTASMLFFQIALLAGYAYAHWSNKWLTPSKQRWLHLGLLVLAFFTLPLSKDGFGFRWAQSAALGGGAPAILVVTALALSVGVSYFAVSAGSPVLQRWFSTTDDKDAANPYFLYALSNIGSMIGLFAYPFFLEPRFGLTEQGLLWKYGFGLLILCFAGSALFVKPVVTETEAVSTVSEITWYQRRNWMFWAAVPTSLLLGATSYISSNVAPVPLIWVVPLATYLLSFVLAFASKPIVDSAKLGRILPLLVVPLAFTLCIEANEPLVPLAGFNVIVLLLGAWMCHAKLSESRPEANQLTEFYLWLSVGGAIGGFFNSFVAPIIFPTYFEYPLAICLACLLRPEKPIKTPVWLWLIVILGVAAVMQIVLNVGLPTGGLRNGLAIGIPLILVFALVERVRLFAAGLLSIFLFAVVFQVAAPGKVLLTKRSFFGVHRVLENKKQYRSLVHGNTTHGRQQLDPAKRLLPLTYYHPTGPIGQIFTKSEFINSTQKIGLVGLGVGSLASYGRPDQEMTYFEIDPSVLEIAKDSGLFSFLTSAKSKMRYVLGDARLTLQNEPDGTYDFLVLDAFSSDAIPTHLLTKEALELYAKKLSPNGIIAFHVSNRYLELEQMLALTARKANLFCFEQTDAPMKDEEIDGKTQSKWCILVRDRAQRDRLWKPQYWNDIDIPENTKAWTDDYVNVLGVFRPSE